MDIETGWEIVSAFMSKNMRVICVLIFLLAIALFPTFGMWVIRRVGEARGLPLVNAAMPTVKPGKISKKFP